ncbi:MAG: DUF3429 domain-containing protein [Rhodobacteraceae bacterium]|nr:DUF3429 domain-containing protein [Paracoccaceae bacterium]
MALHLPPRTPLALATLGTAPFVIGAIGAVTDTVFTPFPYSSVGSVIHYGVVILSFLTGILWGFASHAPQGQSSYAYITGAIPALYVFFAVAGSDADKLEALMFGFPALLVIDTSFQKSGLAPKWWLTLRIPSTLLIIACLFLTRISI